MRNYLLCAATMFILATGRLAISAESESALAERIFGNADKNKDSSLDDKEVLEAKRIFKAAILQGKKADDLPGGKSTLDKIQEAATKKGKLDDNKNGTVTKEEWLGYVKDAFKQKDAIIKDAKEKIAAANAAAKKKQDEQNKLNQLRREKEQLQKKLNQKNNKK